MPTLTEIVEYANEYLRIRDIEDWPNALNGLQIENSGRVTKIGAAVDAVAHDKKADATRAQTRRLGERMWCSLIGGLRAL